MKKMRRKNSMKNTLKNEPIHYEEAEDFKEIIDWDKVWAMDVWDKSRVLRGLKEPPKKIIKVKKNA